jgi:sulfur-carrier protein
MIRVELPFHLRTLARVEREVTVEVAAPVTVGAILAAVEARYPVLRGTIRDHVLQKRRPFLRFYACEEDFSNAPLDTPLPAEVASGKEPFSIIGAIAGGL